MRKAFCTVVTVDFIPYALAQHDSIVEHGSGNEEFYIFISTPRTGENKSLVEKRGLHYLFTDDLCQSGNGNLIYKKYYNEHIGAFRWSMKPVLVTHLVEKENYDKVIFLDADIYFYGKYEFIFDRLDQGSVLLSPHSRCADPDIDPINFQKNFSQGVFNGGFIAINRKGLKAMEWLAKACLFNCTNDPSKGYYYDQKYFDFLPARFSGVMSLDHPGCNVAEWNMIDCKRSVVNGNVVINNLYPIIFIHFSSALPGNIFSGDDGLLLDYLIQYSKAIGKYNPSINLIQKLELQRDKAIAMGKLGRIEKVKVWLWKVKRRLSQWLDSKS
jgi:hypothetical protein